MGLGNYPRRHKVSDPRRPVFVAAGENTNKRRSDIGMRIPVDEIYSGLRSTWDLALSKGSKVLALTVPETHAKGPSVDERAVLNAKIQKHRARNLYA